MSEQASTGEEVEAKAVISTRPWGDIEVPLTGEQFDEAVAELADEAGWDVGFVARGITGDLLGPTVVGIVIRVPGIADPMDAVAAAQGAVPDEFLFHLDGMQTMKCIVTGFDEFGDDD